jgi:CHAT domain-containing protein
MYAGTPSVSVTLWPVESESTVKLSTGFFQGLKEGKGRAVALQEIKLRMLRGDAGKLFQHPIFWAPYIIFGEGQR